MCMAYHPVNLALRFGLELVGLYALGYWGWSQHSGWLRYLLAIGVPLLAAVIWATFKPIEPLAPKKIPVVVPGRVRLPLELAYFGLATGALAFSQQYVCSGLFGLAVVFHYLTSLDRVSWLLKRG
jgi:hypothetical protein